PTMLAGSTLSPVSNTTADSHAYYTSASIGLTGSIGVGDVWTLTVDGKDYVHTVAATSETLTSIATSLLSKVTAQKPTGATYAVTRSGATLSISDAAGFWFDLNHDVKAAAAIVETGTVA